MPSLEDAFVAGTKFIENNSGLVSGLVGIGLGAGTVGLIIAGSQTPSFMEGIPINRDLMVPTDLINVNSSGESRQYYITFQFAEYQRRSIFDQPFAQNLGGIRLPIPNNLVDTMTITYEQESAPGAVGAGIEQGISGRNQPGSTGSTAMGILSTVGSALGGKAIDATVQAAQSALAGSASQGLQLVGLAQNPFLTILFKQPTFKRHQFSWKLTPNNLPESDTLKNIINVFKYNMLPAMAPSTGGTLLKYPNMVFIQLSPKEDYLYKFKPCVIESMSVNYASAGMPSFFKGSDAPTDVTLSINLLEIEYWLKEDIAGNLARIDAGKFF
jgi:hypothetical protein